MADSVRLRPGGPADAVRLCEIERLVSPGPWSLSQFISACRSERERVVVADCGTAGVQGFAIFSQILDEATLLNIAVDPHWQGTGLGRHLLESVLSQLEQRGCTRCLLEVRAGNAVAIGLYRSGGFTQDGRRLGYYPPRAAGENREDALLMSRDLSGGSQRVDLL